MKFFGFYTVLTIICIILFISLYYRFVRHIQNRKWRRFFKLFLFFLFSAMIVTPFFRRYIPSFLPVHWHQTTISFYYILLGLMSFIMTYLIIAIIPEKIFYLIKKMSDKPIEESRKLRLINLLNLGIIFASLSSTIWGMIICARPPEIVQVNIPQKNLPEDLKKFNIVQISDLHIDTMQEKEWLQSVIDRVNELRPSVVVITGDLIDGPIAHSHEAILLLTQLQSTYGTYFVTGNHEYYSGPENWIPFFKKIGLKVLENENSFLQVGNARVMIGGVPDKASKIKLDHERASKNTGAKTDLSILLAHRPENCSEAARAGFNLQLSGHSHDGQFIPWTWVVKFIQPYAQGLYNHEGMWVYVNQGTGFWGPPIRLGTHSEITQIHFQNQ